MPKKKNLFWQNKQSKLFCFFFGKNIWLPYYYQTENETRAGEQIYMCMWTKKRPYPKSIHFSVIVARVLSALQFVCALCITVFRKAL